MPIKKRSIKQYHKTISNGKHPNMLLPNKQKYPSNMPKPTKLININKINIECKSYKIQ